MSHTLTFFKALILAALLAPLTTADPTDQRSLEQLEDRLSAIDAERADLANITLRSGVGNLGWLSQLHSEPAHTEWAQVNFARTHSIDQITLVPVLWRDPQIGTQADGFPTEFKVIVGNRKVPQGTVVASFTKTDNLQPRQAPLVIPISPLSADWIRVEATELSPRSLDGSYLFQLSEIMAFSGAENVALHQTVSVSSSTRRRVSKSNPKETLVDGVTPYLINAQQGKASTAFVAFFNTGPQAILSMDLGKFVPINRIHLHATDLSENVPQIHHADYGVPKHLIVEASLDPEFSKPITLIEFERETIYDTGPTLMWRFPETQCRYLRIRAIEAYKAPEASERWRCIGFAEIEVFSDGTNIARDKSVRFNLQPPSQQGSLDSLTDGRNHFGNIIPLRSWVEQLARRHDLEVERPLVEAKLDKHYERQKSNLRIMSWLAAALAAGIIISILLNRISRLRQTAQLKERFAADLHDELGADLHTIGLLSDLAQSSQGDPKKLNTYLQQIRSATEEAGTAVRNLADMQTEAPYADMPAAMRQIADRVVVHLQHDFSIVGESHINQLPPATRSDLILFYKECLINICRHSEATSLTTSLKCDDKETQLSISDNGHGLTDLESGQVPHSLQRRAKLLGGKVTVNSSTDAGTTIHLNLRLPRFKFRK